MNARRRRTKTCLLNCQLLPSNFSRKSPCVTQADSLAYRTALNLITAFAVALKHKLRFEPYTYYDDISNLVGHLDTFALHATHETPSSTLKWRPSKLKATGEYLGISFAASNPRKAIKKATRPLGNLPLEILSYLASFTDEIIENGQLKIPMQQTLACKSPFRGDARLPWWHNLI